MEYFELSQSGKVENAIEIMELGETAYCRRMSREDFEKLDRLKVAYYSGREYEEICDILTNPTFLVSDGLKRILECYDKEAAWKGVQLFPTEEEVKRFPLYWVPYFQEMDCRHEMTQTYDNGMLKKLVLDESKTGGLNVFRVRGLLEYKVMVSLPLAESILRRRFYGVELRKAEVV